MYSLQNSSHIPSTLYEKIKTAFPLINSGRVEKWDLDVVNDFIDTDSYELSTKLGLSTQVLNWWFWIDLW